MQTHQIIAIIGAMVLGVMFIWLGIEMSKLFKATKECNKAKINYLTNAISKRD